MRFLLIAAALMSQFAMADELATCNGDHGVMKFEYNEYTNEAGIYRPGWGYLYLHDADVEKNLDMFSVKTTEFTYIRQGSEGTLVNKYGETYTCVTKLSQQ